MKTRVLSTCAVTVLFNLLSSVVISAADREASEFRRDFRPPARDRERPAPIPMPRGGIEGMGELVSVLKPEQRERLREAFHANREKLEQLQQKIRDTSGELHHAVLDGRKDAIMDQAQRLGKIHAELALTRAKIFGSIAPTLSEGQRDRIRELRRQLGSERSSPGPGGYFERQFRWERPRRELRERFSERPEREFDAPFRDGPRRPELRERPERERRDGEPREFRERPSREEFGDRPERERKGDRPEMRDRPKPEGAQPDAREGKREGEGDREKPRKEGERRDEEREGDRDRDRDRK